MLTLGEKMTSQARLALVRAELRRIDATLVGHDDELDREMYIATKGILGALDRLDHLIAGDDLEEVSA